MDAIMIYILFAVTTALTSCLMLLAPALVKIKEIDPVNQLLSSKVITYGTFFIIGVLAAPILLIPLFMVRSNEKFIDTFAKTITS